MRMIQGVDEMRTVRDREGWKNRMYAQAMRQ